MPGGFDVFSGRRAAMSWTGHPVIDLDSHTVERADRFSPETETGS
jgi:hypothetical protein